jgi:hypothetical protein
LSFKASASTTVLIVDDSICLLPHCARFLVFEKILQHTYICMKVLRKYSKASKSLV